MPKCRICGKSRKRGLEICPGACREEFKRRFSAGQIKPTRYDTCSVCGKETGKHFLIHKHGSKTCSRECMKKQQSKSIKEANQRQGQEVWKERLETHKKETDYLEQMRLEAGKRLKRIKYGLD